MPTSSVQDNLGRLHISAGTVTYLTNVASLVTNDGGATVASTGNNNATITWTDAFTTAPEVAVCYIKGTFSAQQAHTVIVEQLTTTTLEVRIHDITDDGLGGTDVFSGGANPADGDGFSYVVIGLRNN